MSKIYYRCRFTDYNGQIWCLDTFDEAKIGPWLAEMFGTFPFSASSPTSLDIQASNWSMQ